MDVMDNFDNLPKRGTILKFKDIIHMELPDTPCFEFSLDNEPGVIQTAHVSVEELATLTELGETEWRYRYTTREWIPVFRFHGDPETLRNVLDIEPSTDEFNPGWWVTPKGFPREQ